MSYTIYILQVFFFLVFSFLENLMTSNLQMLLQSKLKARDKLDV